MKSFTIGQVAKHAGVGVETVRFYERKGLLEEPQRKASGSSVERRNLASRSRRSRNFSNCGLKRDGQWEQVAAKKYRLVQRVGRLSKLDRVKLVFTRRPREKS